MLSHPSLSTYCAHICLVGLGLSRGRIFLVVPVQSPRPCSPAECKLGFAVFLSYSGEPRSLLQPGHKLQFGACKGCILTGFGASKSKAVRPLLGMNHKVQRHAHTWHGKKKRKEGPVRAEYPAW